MSYYLDYYTSQYTEGNFAQFVNVTLKNSKQGTISNEDGEFLLKNVKVGEQTVVLQFVGLKTEEKTVVVNANKTTELAINLEESTNELSEVTVTGVQSANEKTVNIGKRGTLNVKSKCLHLNSFGG